MNNRRIGTQLIAMVIYAVVMLILNNAGVFDTTMGKLVIGTGIGLVYLSTVFGINALYRRNQSKRK